MKTIIALLLAALLCGCGGTKMKQAAFAGDSTENLAPVTEYAPMSSGASCELATAVPAGDYILQFVANPSAPPEGLLMQVFGVAGEDWALLADIEPQTAGEYHLYTSAFTLTDTRDIVVFIYVDSDVKALYLGPAPAPVVQFSRAPLRPSHSLTTPQALAESAGAVRVGHDYVAAAAEFDLPLRMTGAELAGFIGFWRDTARGMAHPFTYLDVAGGAQTVKFAAQQLPQITEEAYDLHTTTARLRLHNS